MNLNINEMFENPFEKLDGEELLDPFEFINAKEDEKKLGSNLVISLGLLIEKLKLSSNAFFDLNKNGFIDIVVQISSPVLNVKRNYEKKEYYATKIYPALKYQFNIFDRNDFKTDDIKKIDPLIYKLLPNHKYVVNITKFKIISVFDKFDFKDGSSEEFKQFKKFLDKHSLIFYKNFCHSEKYPKIVKTKNGFKINYPSKKQLIWNLLEPKKELLKKV